MTRRIAFFAPSLKRYDIDSYTNANTSQFLPISITGTTCALRCAHCNTRLLQIMRAVETSPQELFHRAAQLKKNGCVGILITGGCDPKGVIPALPYAPILRRLRTELGLKIALHTKFLDRPLAEALAQAEIDRVLVDVIGSEETLRSVFHVNATLEVVERTVSLINEYRLRASPHVIIGIHYGKILGEEKALHLLSGMPLESLVLVVISPLRGTKMHNVSAPRTEEVRRIFQIARSAFPETPLVLGCARPTGRYGGILEETAIRQNFDGIAYPSEETVKLCATEEIDFEFSPLCCAFCPSTRSPTSLTDTASIIQ